MRTVMKTRSGLTLKKRRSTAPQDPPDSSPPLVKLHFLFERGLVLDYLDVMSLLIFRSCCSYMHNTSYHMEQLNLVREEAFSALTNGVFRNIRTLILSHPSGWDISHDCSRMLLRTLRRRRPADRCLSRLTSLHVKKACVDPADTAFDDFIRGLPHFAPNFSTIIVEGDGYIHHSMLNNMLTKCPRVTAVELSDSSCDSLKLIPGIREASKRLRVLKLPPITVVHCLNSRFDSFLECLRGCSGLEDLALYVESGMLPEITERVKNVILELRNLKRLYIRLDMVDQMRPLLPRDCQVLPFVCVVEDWTSLFK